jgi:ABC-type sugar transport system ATPase subunit
MTENTQAASRTTGFYEAKGMIRRTVILNKGYPDKLSKIAEDYSLSQGEVVEVFLDQFDANRLGEHLKAKKVAKKPSARLTKTDMVKKMKDLKPEQLAAIEAIIRGSQ